MVVSPFWRRKELYQISCFYLQVTDDYFDTTESFFFCIQPEDMSNRIQQNLNADILKRNYQQ
jgi:hypothetical protein